MSQRPPASLPASPEPSPSDNPIMIDGSYPQDSDESILRSMARRKRSSSAEAPAPKRCREPGCDKEFKRPCDLTKHEKTHSRPWKCPEESCKYHEYGWPTEKEMDRHHNDKHSIKPDFYECHFKPCPYRSPRESNCVQHMEKAHGWNHDRSLNIGLFDAPQTAKIRTPGSDLTKPKRPETGRGNRWESGIKDLDAQEEEYFNTSDGEDDILGKTELNRASVNGASPLSKPLVDFLSDEENENMVYTCTYHGCTLRFVTQADYRRHKRVHHRTFDSQTREKVRRIRKTGACWKCWIEKVPCSDCSEGKMCKLPAAVSLFAASSAPRYKPPENQRKVLRVLIKNKEHLACPDSGSAKNIMSESLANELGLTVRCSIRDIKQFELGNGTRISSVGRVRVPVELPGTVLGRKKCWFYVFSSCPVPLILGMPFLEQAQILTKNRHILESCPPQLSNISSLLWIGSSGSGSSPRNRFECTLDGHELEAVADTGSDLNLMSLKCARREGFQIDRRREARRRLCVGDGTETETIGQVYIYNLSLDWRKPPTTSDIPVDMKITDNTSHDTSSETDGTDFGAIFHVLPGLPCDVIFGRDLLDQTDAFNLCPKLSPARTARKNNPFELNVLISLGPVSISLPLPRRRRLLPVANLDPKEAHDDARHAEVFRRTKREEEIALLPVEHQSLARSRESRRIRDWDALHRTCSYCNPV